MEGSATSASDTLDFARVMIHVIATDIDEGDAGAGQGLLEALDTLARIVGTEQANETKAFAAMRHRVLGNLRCLLPRQNVGGADIGNALRLRRIAVGGEQGGFGRELVEFRGRGSWDRPRRR